MRGNRCGSELANRRSRPESNRIVCVHCPDDHKLRDAKARELLNQAFAQ